MIGAIVGDVIGSVYEGHGRTKDPHFPLFCELSHPTDDSVLTIAVARAILEANGLPTVDDYTRQLREVGSRYPRAGYGGSFRAWLRDKAAGPYGSWGNGSAMRVSPVGWAFDSEREVLEHARLTALPTHSHPEGVKGAEAVGLAVFMARSGATKAEIRTEITSRFAYNLERTVDSIRPTYQFDLTCQGSVPEAMIAFFDSSDFESAIRNAVSLGGDADTQACIAGAIAEAFYGEIPAVILSRALRKLDGFLLCAVRDFAVRYMPASVVAGVVDRRSNPPPVAERPQAAPATTHSHTTAGTPPKPGTDGVESRSERDSQESATSPRYTVLLHTDAWRRLTEYAERLNADRPTAGARLAARLHDIRQPRIDATLLLVALLATKVPRIFAESEVRGDGSDWTIDELRLLGDVSVAVPVTVYDDGRHQAPRVHDRPFAATLLFVPGALLRSGGSSEAAADRAEVVRSGKIDPERYAALYERRLLPALRYASSTAEAAGRQVLVTIPGLGCGQFAGPFQGTLGLHLRDAIASILRRHAGSLAGIRAVWFDPYSECDNEQMAFGHLTLFVRPLLRNKPGLPQLSQPAAFAHAAGEPELADCELASVVAWDHVSWPGNDFFAGARSTDDGVKAAATDAMFALTGCHGCYNASTNSYDPPRGMHTWEDLVVQSGLHLRATGNVVVIGSGSGEVGELG